MSDEESSVPLSKMNKREVTSFLGHELLFDYISGQLDEERKKAVDLFLSNSKEAQQDLIKILNGVKYAEQLADTVVSQSIIEKVQEPETYLSVLLQKSRFDRWPVSVKWAIEAMVVVTGVVALLVLIPWDKALRLDLSTTNQEVILAEVKKPLKSNSDATANVTAEPAEKAEFIDEPPVGKPIDEPKEVASKEKVDNKNPTLTESSKKSEPQLPAKAKQAPPKPVVAAAESNDTEANSEEDSSDSEEKIAKASSGSLFRGVLKVTNAAAVTPKISEKIVQLGGRKAGEVELGWKKTENSFYYHFTIPEAKLEELKTYLAEYSTVQIKKETHPRVMPEGIVRLIIQVEEKKP